MLSTYTLTTRLPNFITSPHACTRLCIAVTDSLLFGTIEVSSVLTCRLDRLLPVKGTTIILLHFKTNPERHMHDSGPGEA